MEKNTYLCNELGKCLYKGGVGGQLVHYVSQPGWDNVDGKLQSAQQTFQEDKTTLMSTN